MRSDIQTLVAEYTRDILLTLADPSRQRQAPPAQEPTRSVAATVVIPHDNAEALTSGGWLLAPLSGVRESRWGVYVMAGPRPEAGPTAFVRRGGIDTTMAPAKLVGAAYRAVLNRAVDNDGEAIYSPLLACGNLSPEDLLRILATSDEAAGRQERLLIVPRSRLPPTGDDEPSTVYFVV